MLDFMVRHLQEAFHNAIHYFDAINKVCWNSARDVYDVPL